MDSSWDDEATQQATQQLPPHNGIAPSDSAGQDYSNVLCFLHPCTVAAIAIVQRAQSANANLVFCLPVSDFDAEGGGPALPDDATSTDEPPPAAASSGSEDTVVDIALRYSPGPKDPMLGYLFGRNPFKCDIPMIEHPNSRRISNMHFRIYVNASGALMLEDLSTNGTWVDHFELKRGSSHGRKRVLSQGSLVGLCYGQEAETIKFIVRIPSYSGKGMQSVTAPAPPDGADRGRLFLNPASPPPPPPPLPTFSLRRHPPGVVQSRQQRNVAAIMRNPLLAAPRAPDDQCHLPVGRDVHTSRRPSSSLAWGGDDRYSVGSQIGKGAFATVHKAFERTSGEVVAVKIIAKRTFATQVGKENLGVKKEVEILERLNHPNIVKYITCFEDLSHIYLVMEYIEHGDLNGYLNSYGSMPEDLTKEVTRQVLRGLEYIHGIGISHRDLKPDNVLIDECEPIHIKLSDFGLAKMVNNEETFLKTFCGTMLYLAPEVFPGYMSVMMGNAQGLEGNGKRKRLPNDDPRGPGSPAKQRKIPKKERKPYSQAVDMWSLGCVVYCLLCGAPPFEGKDQDDMCRLVTRGKFDEAKLKSFVGADADGCIDFLHRLLQVRPEMRMMEQEALGHEWLWQEAVEESLSMDFEEDKVQGVEVSTGSRQAMEEGEDGERNGEGKGKGKEVEVGVRVEEGGGGEGGGREGGEQAEGGHGGGDGARDLATGAVEEPEDESEEEEDKSEGEGGQPTPRANKTKVVNEDLQDSMARVTFDPLDAFDLQTSDNGTSSSGEGYESLADSRHEYSQGETGISVIDRARADARNVDPSSRQGSSGVFPDGGLHLSSSEGSDRRQRAGADQRLGDAFEYEQKRRERRQEEQQRAGTGSGCGARGFEAGSAEDRFMTPPSHPPNGQRLPPALSPFSPSLGGGAHFNLSPDSLRNPSPRQPPPPPHQSRASASSPIAAPAISVGPDPADDDLPPTQSVCSQMDGNVPKFRIPPIPWGHLVPMRGSLATEPVMLIEQMVSFGRSSNCSIKPDDIRISKFHFAIQIHYPDRPRQTDPRESRVGEWRPTANMVVSFQVLGRSGVYINGKRFADKSIGRLWDGDVVELFRDFSGVEPEVFGYKVELTIGDVRRDSGSNNGGVSLYTPGLFEALRRDAVAAAAGGRQGGGGVSVANTEIPGSEMRIRA